MGGMAKKTPNIFSGENQIKTLFGIPSTRYNISGLISAWENFLQVHLIPKDLLRRLLDNDIAWHSKVRCISVCKATENFHCWVKVNELVCFLEGFSCSCLLLDGATVLWLPEGPLQSPSCQYQYCLFHVQQLQ